MWGQGVSLPTLPRAPSSVYRPSGVSLSLLVRTLHPLTHKDVRSPHSKRLHNRKNKPDGMPSVPSSDRSLSAEPTSLYTVNISTKLCAPSVKRTLVTLKCLFFFFHLPIMHFTGLVGTRTPCPVQTWLGFSFPRFFPSTVKLVQQFRRIQIKGRKDLSVFFGRARRVGGGLGRVRSLIRVLERGGVLGPVEPTHGLVELVQLGRQRDPQLLVEGQGLEPVFQFLERRAERAERGGGVKTGATGRRRRRGCLTGCPERDRSRPPSAGRKLEDSLQVETSPQTFQCSGQSPESWGGTRDLRRLFR